MGVHKYFLTEKLEGSPLQGVWRHSPINKSSKNIGGAQVFPYGKT